MSLSRKRDALSQGEKIWDSPQGTVVLGGGQRGKKEDLTCSVALWSYKQELWALLPCLATYPALDSILPQNSQGFGVRDLGGGRSGGRRLAGCM